MGSKKILKWFTFVLKFETSLLFINCLLILENFKNDINVKFSEPNDHFNKVQAKYEMVNSNMSISRCCNELLLEDITQLECNNLNNTQYNKRETLEINPVPPDIADDILELSLCQVLSLTEVSVEPDDLQACHHMRKKDRVIIKFKCRKQQHHVLSNHKTLQNKSLDLTQLKFSGELFVNESMCHENQQLAYKCCQLKSTRKIHSKWFYSRMIPVQTPLGAWPGLGTQPCYEAPGDLRVESVETQ